MDDITIIVKELLQYLEPVYKETHEGASLHIGHGSFVKLFVCRKNRQCTCGKYVENNDSKSDEISLMTHASL